MSDPAHQPGQWAPQDPMPAQPLPYVIPDRAGRPGLITAIGVLSIVLACIGGFWGLITTFQAVGFYFASVMSASVAAAQAKATQAQLPVAVSQPSPGEIVVGPHGMNAQEREAAIESLIRLRPLTPARRRHLDMILASSGQDIGPGEVTQSGTMEQLRTDEQPPDFFVTSRGRLEVFNDRAVFFPLTGAIIRAAAPPLPPAGAPSPPVAPRPAEPEEDTEGATVVVGPAGSPATGPATPATSSLALSPAEVQAIVQQAQTVSGNGLNPSQANALTSVLSSPGHMLVTPGAAQGAVISAYTGADGSAVVMFSNGGSVTMDPKGAVTNVTSVPTFTGFSISPVALGMMVVTSLLLMALAVYLLVCGILTLRQSPRGRRLHLIYAFIKIPLTVAAGVASAWVMSDMMSGLPGGGAAPTRVALFTGVVPVLLGCAYPVALLIALNVRSVREYYSAAV